LHVNLTDVVCTSGRGHILIVRNPSIWI
jgi:hypothetical protein